jgi:hypothetical protein
MREHDLLERFTDTQDAVRRPTTVASSTRGADVKHEVKSSGAIVIIALIALLGACRQPPGPEPPGDPPAPQSEAK